MKRIIALFLVSISLLGFCACANKNAQVEKELSEKIPNAYTGESEVSDTVKIDSLEVEVYNKIFVVDGKSLSFSDFEGKEGLSYQVDGGWMEVYVTDGVIQRFVFLSDDSTEKIEYDANGDLNTCTLCEFDHYSNTVLECTYDAQGVLQGFYTAVYNKLDISEKSEYNGSYDLLRYTQYYYDNAGELDKEAVYGPDSKLIKIIEH